MFQNGDLSVLWLNEIWLLPVLLNTTLLPLFFLALICQMFIFITMKQAQNWVCIQIFWGIQLSAPDFHEIPLKLGNYAGSHPMPLNIVLSKFSAVVYIYIGLESALMF